MAKFADQMEKIAAGVVDGYKKIEHGVVDGFTGITRKASEVMLNEDGSLKTGKVGEAVVGAYHKVEDAFVDTFIAREGESLEDARERLAAQQAQRMEQAQAEAQQRAARQQEMIDASLEAAKNAGKQIR